MEESYTRAELESVGPEPPARGVLCPHCGLHIPRFAELAKDDERRVRQLIREGRRIAAILELSAFSGCPKRWAQIWVEHRGEPIYDLEEETPCPYCGKPLRTSRAKQCRHCKRDWHDPERLKWLGEKHFCG